MAVEIDSFYVETIDSDRTLTAVWPDGTGALAYGQTFRPTSNYKLTSCKFRLRRSATALTGNLKAYLYTHAGTFAGSDGLPTGSPLATSDSLDLATLTGTYTLYTFTFDGTYTLVANTAYCLVVYTTDGSVTASYWIRVASRAADDPGHEGRGLRFLSSVGAWQAYSTVDVMFYVYGNLALDVDVEVNQFPDNVANSVTAATIEAWLDSLSITTLHSLNINYKGGFYIAKVVYE